MSAYYDNSKINSWNYPDSIQMYSTTLEFIKSIQKRYAGTVTLDYQLPEGDISFLNLFSRGSTNTDTYSELYPTTVQGGSYVFGAQRETANLDVLSNILSYKQSFGSLTINANFRMRIPTILLLIVGIQILQAQQLHQFRLTSLLQRLLRWVRIWLIRRICSGQPLQVEQLYKQDDRQASLDLEKKLNLSDQISMAVKVGGVYKYTTRYYNYDETDGIMNIGSRALRRPFVHIL